MRLSVVIPAYNEERGIVPVLTELRGILTGAGVDAEIVVVDDGSTDRTAEALERSGLPVRVVRNPRNLGYGASLRRGIAAASGDWILITDADGTYPAAAIPELLARAVGNDMVVGARTKAGAAIPLLRRPPKWVLAKLANYLTGTRIPDLNSGLRLMRREALAPFLSLTPDGFSFTTTVTLAMLTSGLAVSFVPIDYKTRVGSSKIRPIRDTLNFLQLIIRTVMYFNPLKVFVPASLALFALSVGIFLYSTLCLGRLLDTTVTILFVGGVQLLAIGMLADLVGKRLK